LGINLSKFAVRGKLVREDSFYTPATPGDGHLSPPPSPRRLTAVAGSLYPLCRPDINPRPFTNTDAVLTRAVSWTHLAHRGRPWRVVDRYEVLVLAKSCPSLHTRTALDDATPDHHRMGRARMRYDAIRHTRCDSARCPTGASLALLSLLSPLRARPLGQLGDGASCFGHGARLGGGREKHEEAGENVSGCSGRKATRILPRIIIILSYYPLIMAPRAAHVPRVPPTAQDTRVPASGEQRHGSLLAACPLGPPLREISCCSYRRAHVLPNGSASSPPTVPPVVFSRAQSVSSQRSNAKKEVIQTHKRSTNL
jgi:hypothetical protein